MGGCEIIPNNSVHWAISHDRPTGGAKSRPVREPSAADGDARDIVTVGVNKTTGVDSIAADQIGKGKKTFQVTLRFGTIGEATDALTQALRSLEKTGKINEKTGLWDVVIDIKAKPTNEENTEAYPMNPYAQIAVVW